MNKKLLAAAVSAAIMAPVGAQAQTPEVTLYGRINNALDFQDKHGEDSTTDISTIGSRVGIRASSDLGNGLTASAQYEFGTTTDNAEDGIGSTRVAIVGISGGFGSVTVGNQWSAFFNTVGTHMDPTYWLGAVGHQGPFRTANTIKYANSFGPVSLQLDARVDDDASENSDGFAIGASFAITDNITIAAAYDSSEDSNGDDTDLWGIGGKVTFGSFFVTSGYNNVDDGSEEDPETAGAALYFGGDLGSTRLMLGLSQLDPDGGPKRNGTLLGAYHNMGGGLRLFFEGNSVDNSDDTGKDKRYLLGMRYDF